MVVENGGYCGKLNTASEVSKGTVVSTAINIFSAVADAIMDIFWEISQGK